MPGRPFTLAHSTCTDRLISLSSARLCSWAQLRCQQGRISHAPRWTVCCAYHTCRTIAPVHICRSQGQMGSSELDRTTRRVTLPLHQVHNRQGGYPCAAASSYLLLTTAPPSHCSTKLTPTVASTWSITSQKLLITSLVCLMLSPMAHAPVPTVASARSTSRAASQVAQRRRWRPGDCHGKGKADSLAPCRM